MSTLAEGGIQLFETLKTDHQRIASVMTQILSSTSEDIATRGELFEELKTLMHRHADVEQNTLYARIVTNDSLRELAQESRREHRWLMRHVEVLSEMPLDIDGWMDQFIRLKENFDFHVCEEEGVIYEQIRGVLPDPELTLLVQEVLLVREAFAA